ncbi:alpha/beta fold hydrolase [Sphingobium sp. HBC34]|uniref:Alpha/beta fold hydrolase n=1 Tax=Sphingobium cyanobacteriorum TaxID=3063954 RepID=A0ABT8ZJT6_9SPHN|nr:alpha/beta fold hydrolase [Sphingobium sp. HBC34]MDO7834797.1 alpha/beta fold hydrolase [Sphingobium sp. HBC34]
MVERTTVMVPGGTLSAFRATAPNPRGLIIALHGGGHDAHYWHHPAAPDASLPILGAALGFDVVILDRAGHGDSIASFPAGLSMAAQVEQIFALADDLGSARGLPVFLIGHSLGATLSLIVAADARAHKIQAVELSGVPVRYHEGQDKQILDVLNQLQAAGEDRMPCLDPQALRMMFFGADGTFDPIVLSDDPADHRSVVAEIVDVIDFPRHVEATARAVRIPVRWCFAAQEASSRVDDAVLATVGDWTRDNPDTRIIVQADCGHNISLHRVGRAYHLAALAFFEEMRVTRK